MTRAEFDKVYLDKVVHCPTEEKAKEFLALADSVGYRWVSSKSLLKKLAWEQYKEETCYEVKKFGLMFGSVDSFSLEGAQIIKYPPQPKFEVGDVVRIKNTPYKTINGKVGVVRGVNPKSSVPYSVKIDTDKCPWFLTEDQLKEVEGAADKGETVDDIIEEIIGHQEILKDLFNRLEQELKNK